MEILLFTRGVFTLALFNHGHRQKTLQSYTWLGTKAKRIVILLLSFRIQRSLRWPRFKISQREYD